MGSTSRSRSMRSREKWSQLPMRAITLREKEGEGRLEGWKVQKVRNVRQARTLISANKWEQMGANENKWLRM